MRPRIHLYTLLPDSYRVVRKQCHWPVLVVQFSLDDGVYSIAVAGLQIRPGKKGDEIWGTRWRWPDSTHYPHTRDAVEELRMEGLL